MKHIYNDIPLQSILYVIPGFVELQVEDWKEQELFWMPEGAKPVKVWEGLAKDYHNMPTRFRYSKIRHMETTKTGKVVFRISTQFERY